ncbi:pilus assembly protein TadE [Duganella ginsengisoli]|uniref:Pilus assembly protein TadE n=2 Tax=Pseudoduganella ginsengisoli TaxID=1462440 RepID=A0A6L6PZX8_9BURK|nr:pilus assembly protein TadE [Pseudoduganella ginsengisoli]
MSSQRQHGAIAIMLALLLLIILCIFTFALDLPQLTNRKTELQGMANAVALSAARELNGSASGVGNAIAKAASTAGSWQYSYHNQTVAWNDSALKFSSSVNGTWLETGAAQSAPNGLIYAKVDTGELDAAHGRVLRVLSQLFSSSGDSTASVQATAIAGRLAINITPIALCAQSQVPAASRANPGPPAYQELVEFGFRRGVSYDLMQLNPAGTSPDNFAIDPFAIPGTMGSSANTAPAMLAPFVCAGVLAMPRITGGTITVSRPFPLASLYHELNSRFDQYTGSTCAPDGAPPDRNIKSYVYTGINWMSATPGGQSAQSTSSAGKLWTIADPLPAPAGNTAAIYGPLWANARAVPFSSYTAGASEPATGYTPFATSTWSTLYKPGLPSANASYPGGTSTPYKATAGTNFLAPSVPHQPGVANRRILNVPLLSCPVAGGTTVAASVIGIGKFFMTVPATATSLYAEFAGAAEEQMLGSQVELIQ